MLYCAFLFLMSGLAVVGCVTQRPGHPDFLWLNGRWEGPNPTGGTLRVNLDVINENEVQGLARLPVPTGYTVAPSAHIYGTVERDGRVDLWIRWSNLVHWRLSRSADGALEGRSGRFSLRFTKQE